MHFLKTKIEQLKIGWNERPLTERDFYLLCRRHKVTAEELPLRVSGFYYCVMGRHYIAVDSKLEPRKKLFVMFHEFAHYLMHAPNANETASYHGVGKKTRKETEADLFALIALMPRAMIENRTPDELIEEGFGREDVAERFGILERHGI